MPHHHGDCIDWQQDEHQHDDSGGRHSRESILRIRPLRPVINFNRHGGELVKRSMQHLQRVNMYNVNLSTDLVAAYLSTFAGRELSFVVYCQSKKIS